MSLFYKNIGYNIYTLVLKCNGNELYFINISFIYIYIYEISYLMLNILTSNKLVNIFIYYSFIILK